LIGAVLFDLDGVLVSTDEYHYQAWKKLFDGEGIPFGRETNESMRGVGRMESLQIALGKAGVSCGPEKCSEMAAKKNAHYLQMLESLGPGDILPGAMDLLAALKGRGIPAAVASASRNAPEILEKTRLARSFAAVVTGHEITKSKPDPQIFLLAADKLGVSPRCCAVVEDACAGIEAALAAGMKAVGVGYARTARGAHYTAQDLAHIDIEELLRDPPRQHREDGST
jgi:beta-phosphoglucomutase